MKAFRVLLGVGILVAACEANNRPSVDMVAEVNSLSLTTSDTLWVTRALANRGRSHVWLNASAAPYDLRNAQGNAACHGDNTLNLDVLELIHLPPDSAIVDVRQFPLAETADCAPGEHSLTFVATFRLRPDGDDSFILRTSPAPFTVRAP